MSTMTAATKSTAPEQAPTVTWRDAVTPLSRASRRRWTICYALLLVLLAASVVDDTFAIDKRSDDEQTPLVLVAGLVVVFGMLRRGTRRIAALDHPDLDERDIEARNSAYRVAFPLLVLVIIAALVLLATSAPDMTRTFRTDQVIRIGGEGWFVDAQALIGLGLWIGLWAVFLPTGALAWREPDALEPETGGGGLAEPIRDALLGFALAGSMVASLATESDVGFVGFIAALALLGGLARRAGGQPMLSRQRKWRVAIGIVIILILVGIAVAIGSGGDEIEGGIIDGGGGSSSGR